MDLIYRLYGLLHRLAKFVISRGKYEKGAKIYLNNKIELGVSSDKAKHNWMHFIKSSLIQDDDKFAGCLYAGYVAEKTNGYYQVGYGRMLLPSECCVQTMKWNWQ